MVKNVLSSSVRGLSWHPVSVEVDVAAGLPSFSIVGLGDAAVQESRERVRSAIRNSWFAFPQKRVTVNLAPAEVRKTWPAFDLAIAVGILSEEYGLHDDDLEGITILGELALDGALRRIWGIVAHAASLVESWKTDLLVPVENAREAAKVRWIRAYGATNLAEALSILKTRKRVSHEGGFENPVRPAIPPEPESNEPGIRGECPDYSDIAGQERAKRALEIAAAGWHNVLLEGAPWSWKTLLCRAFEGILPPASDAEILTLAKVRSIAGKSDGDPFSNVRPFVAVHPWASVASLLWWGPGARPGEITLANLGTLFLDELREFPPYLLDALRQPLEDGEIRVSRALWSHTYPARFQLLAASNPCPCGYAGDREKPCVCAPTALERYRNRISGPVLDRIDLFVGVPRLSSLEIGSKSRGSTSAEILARTSAARKKQAERFGNSVKTNAAMMVRDLEACGFSTAATTLALESVDRLGLSGRAHDRIRKVARTIADLAGSDTVEAEHVAEAVGYRQR